MSMREEDEVRAEAWLRKQGYAASRPTWLPQGRNPDFWAECVDCAPNRLWVEVKSIEPDDSTAAMGRFANLIGSATVPPGLRGHALLELAPDAIEQSIRWCLRAFTSRAPAFASRKATLIFIQQTRDAAGEFRIEIDADAPIVVWAHADALPLNPGTALSEDALMAAARVTAPDGAVLSGPAYRFFEQQHPMQCVLALRLDPTGRDVKDIGYMSGGHGQARPRTIAAVETANRQIKTACTTRDAAGIVVLTPRGPFGDNDQMIQAALYGQYTVPVRLEDGSAQHGDLYHGVDGVFRVNKNRHISAAVHLRSTGPATYFPNPYALHPIPDDARLFDGSQRAEVEFT